MTDLIERLRCDKPIVYPPNDPRRCKCLGCQAADEIERLRQDRLCRCADEVRCEMQTEIERLRVERRTLPEYDDAIQAISKENLRLESENAKLQAVVDAAKEAFDDEQTGLLTPGHFQNIGNALAALEDDDE